MSGGAPKEVLAILIPEFEKKTGHKVQMTYIVINAMQQKLAAGEKPNMVLMPVPAIEARVKEGMFRGDGWAALGTVANGGAEHHWWHTGDAEPDVDVRRAGGVVDGSGDGAAQCAAGCVGDGR